MTDPGLSRVEVWVRFAPDLPADVVFGIDHEYLEGKDTYINIESADWLALASVTRNGQLIVRAGTEDERNGVTGGPEQWELYDLGFTLQPDTWYKLTSVADLSTLVLRQVPDRGTGRRRHGRPVGCVARARRKAPGGKAFDAVPALGVAKSRHRGWRV